MKPKLKEQHLQIYIRNIYCELCSRSKVVLSTAVSISTAVECGFWLLYLEWPLGKTHFFYAVLLVTQRPRLAWPVFGPLNLLRPSTLWAEHQQDDTKGEPEDDSPPAVCCSGALDSSTFKVNHSDLTTVSRSSKDQAVRPG